MEQVLQQNPALNVGYHSHFKDSIDDKKQGSSHMNEQGLFHKIDYKGESELFFTFQAVDMSTALPVMMKALKVRK